MNTKKVTTASVLGLALVMGSNNLASAGSFSFDSSPDSLDINLSTSLNPVIFSLNSLSSLNTGSSMSLQKPKPTPFVSKTPYHRVE